MARAALQGEIRSMPDILDPVALLLRFVGAFYAFAGIVAGRAALTSGVLDAALAGISGKSPSLRERTLTWWLTASSWLVFASGILLMILAREAMWAFVACSLAQAFYLTIAAPYYFDVEDPPDPTGRRRTTNAFFIYLGATMAVIWASGRYLTPVFNLPDALMWGASAAIVAFAAHLAWHSLTTSRMPKVNPFSMNGEDNTPDEDVPALPRAFDPRMLRVELSRDGGASPLKNQKTGEDIDLDSLPIGNSLKANLLDWFRDGDPEMSGMAYNLAEQVAHECPDVAVAEPGVPNAYFNMTTDSPYRDQETGAPNWDRMTAVKIMCDYDCHPCWAANGGAVGCVPPSVLQISSDLEDALLSWQNRFDASINRDDPADPIWTQEECLAHEAEGLALAARVKAERPEMTILVHHSRGVLIVDGASPPEEWQVRPG
jgi:hypothetical protein